MSKFVALDQALHDYVLAHRTPDDELLRALQEETARLGDRAKMQIAPDQGTFLRLLVAATGARRAVEIGTFTGMSALCIARGLGPEGRLLRGLPAHTVFDFGFIDADKASYAVYYEEILKRLRPGGLVVVDNVLWSGDVVRPEKQEEDVVAIRRFNDLVAADSRVESVILPVADGLTLARKL
jgi:caffeoyl-CoA O-methyltransferase